MNKRLCRLLAGVLAATALLAGCAQKTVTLDIQEAADSLKAQAGVNDSLTLLTDSLFDSLYGIAGEDVKGKVVYTSAEATADEVAVIEATDADAAARVKEAVETRVADQKDTFESYAPEEVTKLDNAVIEVAGNYVLFCVSGDADKARSAVDQLLD